MPLSLAGRPCSPPEGPPPCVVLAGRVRGRGGAAAPSSSSPAPCCEPVAFRSPAPLPSTPAGGPTSCAPSPASASTSTKATCEARCVPVPGLSPSAESPEASRRESGTPPDTAATPIYNMSDAAAATAPRPAHLRNRRFLCSLSSCLRIRSVLAWAALLARPTRRRLSLPAPSDCAAPISARAKASMDGNRSSGSFESARWIASLTCAGTSGRRALNGAGSSLSCFMSSSRSPSATSGYSPVSISYATSAKEYWSVRASTSCCPSHCSGAM